MTRTMPGATTAMRTISSRMYARERTSTQHMSKQGGAGCGARRHVSGGQHAAPLLARARRAHLLNPWAGQHERGQHERGQHERGKHERGEREQQEQREDESAQHSRTKSESQRAEDEAVDENDDADDAGREHGDEDDQQPHVRARENKHTAREQTRRRRLWRSTARLRRTPGRSTARSCAPGAPELPRWTSLSPPRASKSSSAARRARPEKLRFVLGEQQVAGPRSVDASLKKASRHRRTSFRRQESRFFIAVWMRVYVSQSWRNLLRTLKDHQDLLRGVKPRALRCQIRNGERGHTQHAAHVGVKFRTETGNADTRHTAQGHKHVGVK